MSMFYAISAEAGQSNYPVAVDSAFLQLTHAEENCGRDHSKTNFTEHWQLNILLF